MYKNKMDHLILFDGYCGLCNGSVNWLMQKDKFGVFQFATLQGQHAKKIPGLKNNPTYLQTVVYKNGPHIYTKSTAALYITKELPFPWKLLYSFIIVPRPIRDYVYDWISNHRYQWFGKLDSCRIPTEQEKHRFLG